MIFFFTYKWKVLDSNLVLTNSQSIYSLIRLMLIYRFIKKTHVFLLKDDWQKICVFWMELKDAIFQWEMFRWLRNLCRHLLLYLIIRIELNRYYFNILISIFNIKFKNEWRLILNHWFQTLVVWSKKKVRHYFSTYDKKASGYEQSKFIFSFQFE